jgi:hypothetical protein
VSDKRKTPVARRTFEAGDVVIWDYLGKTGDTGVVVKVTKKKLSGGSTAIVRVKWDSNGHIGSVEDRVIRHVEGGEVTVGENLQLYQRVTPRVVGADNVQRVKTLLGVCPVEGCQNIAGHGGGKHS